MFRFPSTALVSLVGLGSIWLTGCGQSEQIERYRVPKEHVLYDLNKVEPASRPKPPPTQAQAVPQRMLAAIVPGDSKAWFFKLTGPPEPVAKQGEAFRQLIQSVRISAAAPDDCIWSLPEGWKELPASGMRYATITVPSDDGPLELTVIPLPREAGKEDEYALSNINRWRGQLGLAPLDLAAMDKSVEKLELDGTTAILVDLVGKGAPGGGMRPPMAGRAPPRSDFGPLTVSYEMPEGWQTGKLSEMRKAAFTVADGDAEVEITIIDLDTTAGALLPNINRWRKQIGLDDVTGDELARQIELFEIDGHRAAYIELVGPNDGNSAETILGAIAPAGGRAWFIKLKGDSQLAAREKARFREFVASLKFKPAG